MRRSGTTVVVAVAMLLLRESGAWSVLPMVQERQNNSFDTCFEALEFCRASSDNDFEELDCALLEEALDDCCLALLGLQDCIDKTPTVETCDAVDVLETNSLGTPVSLCKDFRECKTITTDCVAEHNLRAECSNFFEATMDVNRTESCCASYNATIDCIKETTPKFQEEFCLESDFIQYTEFDAVDTLCRTGFNVECGKTITSCANDATKNFTLQTDCFQPSQFENATSDCCDSWKIGETCGRANQTEMDLERCGTESFVAWADQFASLQNKTCGEARITPEATATATATPEATASSSSSARSIGIGVGVVLVILVVGIALFLFFKRRSTRQQPTVYAGEQTASYGGGQDYGGGQAYGRGRGAGYVPNEFGQ